MSDKLLNAGDVGSVVAAAPVTAEVTALLEAEDLPAAKTAALALVEETLAPLPQVSGGEIIAGTEIAPRAYSPKDVKDHADNRIDMHTPEMIMFRNNQIRRVNILDHANSGSGTSYLMVGVGGVAVGSATADAWQRLLISDSLLIESSITGAKPACNIPFAVSLLASVAIAASPNVELVFIFNDSGSGAPTAFGSPKLTGKGFGLRLWHSGNTKAELFAYNSGYITSSVPADLSLSSVSNYPCNFILSNNGAGRIRLYYAAGAAIGGVASSTPLLELTGAATAGTYADASSSVFIRNGSTAPSSGTIIKLLSCMLHLNPSY